MVGWRPLPQQKQSSARIFPGGTVRAAVCALRRYYSRLIADGTTRARWPEMLDLAGSNDVPRTDEFLGRGQSFDPGTIDRPPTTGGGETTRTAGTPAGG
jgi:hypothetical protein